MLVLIAPAKRMRAEVDFFQAKNKPMYLEKTKVILDYLKQLKMKEMQLLLKCNDKIASDSYLNIQRFDFSKRGVPALFAYDGIQYQYIAPSIMEGGQLDYLQHHLRILSAFYGVLKPFDEVLPYRLELDDFLEDGLNLKEFWKEDWLEACDDEVILDLTSKQYGRQIHRYNRQKHIVTCRFKEAEGNHLVEKGVFVKMARGRMVRYLAEHQIQKIEDVKEFSDLGFCYQSELSSEHEYVFTRQNGNSRKKQALSL